MAFSKVTVIILLALLFSVLSAQAAEPVSAPAPGPDSAAGGILPSFGFAFASAIVAYLFGYGLHI
uniref:Uncharacterized protein n=1 Tax=Rhizophora mucronata TaxID=61149 RepID=A0A2P2JTX1_RHIMU